MNRVVFRLLTATALVATSAAAPSGRPQEPQAFSLHPSLQIEPYLAEPDVVDPVGMTFDADGRLFVVEMRDYPEGIGPDGRPGGTVRMLEDTTGDGRYDRATLFAEGLSVPTSIAPWNGGVLVTAPPDILFLKDTDGDGRADVRDVVLTGFRRGVTDSNVNGLRWGLDNRVHGANGGNGGRVFSPAIGDGPVDISNKDFAVDPITGEWSTTYGTGGGFGLVFDEFGRSFTTYNLRHILHRVMPVRYLDRFPGMPPANPVLYISDHSDSSQLPSYARDWGHGLGRIHPVSTPVTRPNHPGQAGHFSAAGGMGFIGWSRYPGDLHGSVLVGDVVGNLVHRDVLKPDGPTFIASRSADEQTREFLASRDNHFRPVGVEPGPDGALYVIDMHRGEIEHPDYIPEAVKARSDLREGDDRGRIYRLTPQGGLPARHPRLQSADVATLVGHLNDDNPWWRTTAQRLLFERQDQLAVPALRALFGTASPAGRVHVLWTLQGLGAVDDALLLDALRDAHAGVRENAVQVAEIHAARSAAVRQALVDRHVDDDARVRFQVALTLGEFEHPHASAALADIALRDAAHRWTGLAVLSSLRPGRETVLSLVFDDLAADPAAGDVARLLLRDWAHLVAARAGQNRVAASALVDRLSSGRYQGPWRLAALEGIAQGLRVAGQTPDTVAMAGRLSALDTAGDLDLAYALADVLRAAGAAEPVPAEALTLARTTVADVAAPADRRVAAARLLGMAPFDESGDALLPLLDGRQPGAVQQAVIRALEGYDDPAVATALMSRWRGLSPGARSSVVHLMVRRTTFHGALLEAVESGRVTRGELDLDLEQRRRLLRQSQLSIRPRAAALFGDEEYSNRSAAASDILARLPAMGDVERGQVIYEQACASCHTLRGFGAAVGPDLSNAPARSIEDLVSNILDPNMAINPAYAAYLAELQSGEVVTGLLRSESADAVVLRQSGGTDVQIPRRTIVTFESLGRSLMPEGLETGRTPQDLRDLVAFMQDPAAR